MRYDWLIDRFAAIDEAIRIGFTMQLLCPVVVVVEVLAYRELAGRLDIRCTLRPVSVLERDWSFRFPQISVL